MKVVFDMDTGVDDSLALIYALNRPAYELQGIGCVYGNVDIGSLWKAIPMFPIKNPYKL